MTHLIFDEDGDFVDSINFDSVHQKTAYLIENPNYTVQEITDDMTDIFIEDDLEDDDDFDYSENDVW